jgi:GT2 family glycosyltransferase
MASGISARSALGATAKIAVIVVNYNGGSWLEASLQSVLDPSVDAVAEIIVVDNGSTDGSPVALAALAQREPRIRYLANGANLGFAAANNRALPLVGADCEYLLFLNPDCSVEPGTIPRMIEAMRANPEAGMAGCLVLNPDGSEQRGCRRRIPTPANALSRALWLDRFSPRRFAGFDLTGSPLPAAPTEVEAISGAFMFVRKSALDAVGPLDEGYFLHCEDLDWCMRFRRAGWKVLFVPDARATHVQGASSRDAPVRVEFHKHRGMIRFYRKFYRESYPLPLLWLVSLGVWLRFAAIALLLSVRSRRLA